jgi:mono/diheme cytochrome c family protein
MKGRGKEAIMLVPEAHSIRTGQSRGTVLGWLALFGLAIAAGLYGLYRSPPRPISPGSEAASVPAPAEPLAHARQLFEQNCAGCHGEKGDGEGVAARFLYPRPRNFQENQFRVVTTVNKVPSEADLVHVITRGMPGSGMMPFGHLSEADRVELATYVRHLAGVGIRDEELKRAAAEKEQINPAELDELIAKLLAPGDLLAVPADLPAFGPESVARGKLLYEKDACAACHGPTGKGDGPQDQRDRSGWPIRPRDFGRGIYKGGYDLQQLLARIMLGMPGTPMPSSTIPSRDAGDLINFVLSLSDPASRARTEHKRSAIIAHRATAPLGPEIDEKTWSAAAPVSILVSPLWWRDHQDPDLEVAALHDGQNIALRLTWKDASKNDSLVRPQDFEDMAAVQLFQGTVEPFLGMGGAGQSVDMWHWRASRHGPAYAPSDVESAHPLMAVDMYPFESPGAGANHPGAQQPREFMTAWAAGNLRSDPSAAFTGSNLQAQGAGSITMRPKASQIVKAQGQWTNGRWTVVLRRSLAVSPEEGVGLRAGERVSVAFALWDGAYRDRNGQKLVSIWHDLHLE